MGRKQYTSHGTSQLLYRMLVVALPKLLRDEKYVLFFPISIRVNLIPATVLNVRLSKEEHITSLPASEIIEVIC